MKVIVVYDIPVEYGRLRNEVRNFLKDIGGRFIEYSVYEADLDPEEIERMIEGLRLLLKKGGGKIDIFFPCKKCYSNIIVIDTYEP